HTTLSLLTYNLPSTSNSSHHSFFFTPPSTPAIYTLSLHDALPISTGTFLTPDPIGYHDASSLYAFAAGDPVNGRDPLGLSSAERDRKSTRLNSSHLVISYAVFCLKKKKIKKNKRKV